MDEAISELFKADPDFMWDDTTNPDFPIATEDTVALQPHYVLPDSSLVINRLRMRDSAGNYQTLDPVTRRELTDDEMRATGTPTKYFKIDNAVFPLPIPNYGATDGIELEFQRGANHFLTTDTTKTPGFSSQFHQWISVVASLRYAIANGMQQKINNLTVSKQALKDQILEHYQRRSPDRRPQLQLKRNNPRNYGFTR